MSVWINQELVNNVTITIKEQYGKKKRVYAYCRPGTWQKSRFIQITTSIKDADIHYEYFEEKVQLHFEDNFFSDEYRQFREYLYEHTKDISGFEWKNWQHHQKGRCVLNCYIESPSDLYDAFNKIINLFDPIIEQYVNEHPELFSKQDRPETITDRSYSLVSENIDPTPEIGIKSVG